VDTGAVWRGYDAPMDPDRSIELLWGTPKAPSRGPKPGLTIAGIVASAIAIADAEGIEAVSMRRVAEALGVGTMSLYRYVPGKRELLALMREAVLGTVAADGRAAGAWRERLERMAREAWEMHRRHPWMLELRGGERRLPGPNEVARFEDALRAVDGIGLTASEMVAVVTLVGRVVESAARGAYEQARTERESGVGDEEWWTAQTAFWERFAEGDRFPTIGRVWESGGFDEPEDDLAFGLARVLDGVERLVRSRS
jgi:AcrR family transcriptional regulator